MDSSPNQILANKLDFNNTQGSFKPPRPDGKTQSKTPSKIGSTKSVVSSNTPTRTRLDAPILNNKLKNNDSTYYKQKQEFDIGNSISNLINLSSPLTAPLKSTLRTSSNSLNTSRDETNLNLQERREIRKKEKEFSVKSDVSPFNRNLNREDGTKRNASIHKFSKSNSSLLTDLYNNNTDKLKGFLKNNQHVEFIGNERFKKASGKDVVDAMKGGMIYNRFYGDYMHDQSMLDRMKLDLEKGNYKDQEYVNLNRMIEECMYNLKRIDLTPVPQINKSANHAQQTMLKTAQNIARQNRRWEYDMQIKNPNSKNRTNSMGREINNTEYIEEEKVEVRKDKEQLEYRLHRDFLDKIQTAFRSYKHKVNNTQAIPLTIHNKNFQFINNKYQIGSDIIQDEFNNNNLYEYIKKIADVFLKAMYYQMEQTSEYYVIGNKFYLHLDYVYRPQMHFRETEVQTDTILNISKNQNIQVMSQSLTKATHSFRLKNLICKIQNYVKMFLKLKQAKQIKPLQSVDYTKHIVSNQKFMNFIIKLQYKLRKYFKRIAPFQVKRLELYSQKKYTIDNIAIYMKVAKIQAKFKHFLSLAKARLKSNIQPSIDYKTILTSTFMYNIIRIQNRFRNLIKRRRTFKRSCLETYSQDKISYSHRAISLVLKIQRKFKKYLNQLKGRQYNKIGSHNIIKQTVDNQSLARIIQIQNLGKKFLQLRRSPKLPKIPATSSKKETQSTQFIYLVMRIQKNFLKYWLKRKTFSKIKPETYEIVKNTYKAKELMLICKVQAAFKYYLSLIRSKKSLKVEPITIKKETKSGILLNRIAKVQNFYKNLHLLKTARKIPRIGPSKTKKIIKNDVNVIELVRIQRIVKNFVSEVIKRRLSNRKYRAFRNTNFTLNSQPYMQISKPNTVNVQKTISSNISLMMLIRIQRIFKSYLYRIKTTSKKQYESSRVRKTVAISFYIRKSEPLIFKPKNLPAYTLTKYSRTLESLKANAIKILKNFNKLNKNTDKIRKNNNTFKRLIMLQRFFKRILMRKVKNNIIKKYKLKSYKAKVVRSAISVSAAKKIQKAYKIYKEKNKFNRFKKIKKFLIPLSHFFRKWIKRGFKNRIYFRFLVKLKSFMLKNEDNQFLFNQKTMQKALNKWKNNLKSLNNTNKNAVKAFKSRISTTNKLNWLINPINSYIQDIKANQFQNLINKLKSTKNNKKNIKDKLQVDIIKGNTNNKKISKYTFKSFNKRVIDVSSGQNNIAKNFYIHYLAPFIQSLLEKNLKHMRSSIFNRLIKIQKINRFVSTLNNRLVFNKKHQFVSKLSNQRDTNKLYSISSRLLNRDKSAKIKYLTSKLRKFTIIKLLHNLSLRNKTKQAFNKIYNKYCDKINLSMLDIRTPNIFTLDNSIKPKTKLTVESNREAQININNSSRPLEMQIGTKVEIIGGTQSSPIKTKAEKTAELAKLMAKNAFRNNASNVISRNETMNYTEYDDTINVQNSLGTSRISLERDPYK